MCILPPGVELGGLKDWCFKDYIVLKWEIRFIFRLNTAEITNYIKSCSNKSCFELNFVQKSPWAHMSIFPTSGAWGAPNIYTFEILKCTEMEKPTSSTPGGDRLIRSLTFLYEIQFWTTFIWSLFQCSAYLWQHCAAKWI